MFKKNSSSQCLILSSLIGLSTIFSVFFREFSPIEKPGTAEAAEVSPKTSLLAQIKLAQDYLNAGNLPTAIALLKKIILDLKTSPNAQLEYKARLTLGNAYLLQGEEPRALEAYLSSFSLASNEREKLTVLNNLSLTYYQQEQSLPLETRKSAQRGKQPPARATAQQALEVAAAVPPSLSTVRAWLNWQKINSNYHPPDYQQQLTILLSLPPSSDKARLLVEMADYTATQKITTLKHAVVTAEKSEDYHTLSWAWGTLGAIAEQKGLFSAALKQTQAALHAAETLLAEELMYRWQWQLGRIQAVLGQTELAQLAYSQAIASVQLIKEDLLISIRRKKIDFAEVIEPLYRQKLELLLSESNYQKAWSIAELLTQSELESYFGDNCFGAKQPKRQPTDVAFIRPLIFEHTTYVMLKLPFGEIKVFPAPIAAADLNDLINQWRLQLELPIDNTYRITGQKLFELLIQPLARDLAQIKQLVFINDGLLRTVPMAALYDGRQHLIEQYSISYAFSSDSDPEISQQQHNNKLLAFGLSASRHNSTALPRVNQELQVLRQLAPGNFFLDRDFTSTNLGKELSQEYNLLHLATHSSFGGSLEATRLQAYDRDISLLELERILLNDPLALQLLVLSGCETAIGDEDALLGLAGIGIRTGIPATIGSIWAVNSASTSDLFALFYDYYLQENLSSSSALRQAQLELIARQPHPYYWSGFIHVH